MFKSTSGKGLTYIFFIVLGTAAVGFYGYFRAGNFTQPQVKVIPSSYDFGRIDPEPVGKSFELKNTGESTLKIEQISTSCSCTTAEVTAREIAPDRSTELRVSFDPTAMDPPIRSEVMRIVYIETNDPNQEETKIKITATVSGGEQVDGK